MPCHSPATDRWYDVLISSRLDDDGRVLGATVTLSLPGQSPSPALARAGPRPRPEARAAAVTPGVLWNMIDAFAEGVALADGEGTLVLASRRLEEMFGYQPTELTGYPWSA